MNKKRTSRNRYLEPISKFRLYEHAVQSPDWQVDQIPYFHKRITGKKPLRMREDFCGTGKISCEWAKKSRDHFAMGLDIDEETLRYAREVNQAALPKAAQERVRFVNQNVLRPTKEKFDVIGAHNFSFFIFHERTELVKYARAAYQSLAPGGTFFLELAGGPGFVCPATEPTQVKVPGYGKITYVWEQHQYDPIRAINDYSIHFKLPDGKWLNDIFTYHWRLWGIRDVQEVLTEAGFKHSVVLWQVEDDKGEGTSEYRRLDSAEDCETWLAYVVGVKG